MGIPELDTSVKWYERGQQALNKFAHKSHSPEAIERYADNVHQQMSGLGLDACLALCSAKKGFSGSLTQLASNEINSHPIGKPPGKSGASL